MCGLWGGGRVLMKSEWLVDARNGMGHGLVSYRKMNTCHCFTGKKGCVVCVWFMGWRGWGRSVNKVRIVS